MSIEPKHFAMRMKQHWIETLGNVSSANLEKTWEQMASAFNQAIQAETDEETKLWRILQPPTGTGKSQGLAVYCSLLAQQACIQAADVRRNGNGPTNCVTLNNGHPIGVLVIVRLITQAEELAKTINILAGLEVALAKHHEVQCTHESMQTSQILIVTHQAYKNALVRTQNPDGINTWPTMSTWQFGPRLLTVIDEALDIIDHSQITLDDLRRAIGNIPSETQRMHTEQMLTLNNLALLLDNIGQNVTEKSQGNPKPRPDKLIERELVETLNPTSMKPLIRALTGVHWDVILYGRHDSKLRTRTADQIEYVLQGVDMLLEQWAWYSRKLGKDTLNVAKLIVPDGLRGPVVLDATASQNLTWELFQEASRPYPTPPKVRSYRNVTLHVSWAQGLGKETSRVRGLRRAQLLIDDMQKQLSPDGRLLICGHKALRPFFAGYSIDRVETDFAHWGAVDGRNDWQDFDSVAIISIPYRDRIWASNTFFAMQGLQTDAWFNEQAQRQWRNYSDIRAELDNRQIAVSVIQAINRIKCRRVIDEFGNCGSANVYIVLPRDKTGKTVLSSIKDEMPEMEIVKWAFQIDGSGIENQRKPRPSKHIEAVLEYMACALPGIYSASHIQKALNIGAGTWRDVKQRLNAKIEGLDRQLQKIGVSIRIELTKGGYERLSLEKS